MRWLTSFAHDSAVRRWPAILTQVVDALYRTCHTLSDKADAAVLSEGKALTERVSGLKHALTHDHALEPLDVTPETAAHLPGGLRAPTTEAYDTVIRASAPSWFDAEW